MNTDNIDWVDRLERLLAWVMQAGLAIIIVAACVRGRWLPAFSGALALSLTFAPLAIAHRLRVQLPAEFHFIACVFLWASFVLGEAGDFYERFWWWDIMLHGFSALVIGMVGFLIAYLSLGARPAAKLPFVVALTTFGLAIGVGVLWEILEFGLDWIFGLNMQRSGLVDTMTDLMVDCVGALCAAVAGYRYVNGGDSLIARRVISRFVQRNRRFAPALKRYQPGDGATSDRC